MSKGYLFLNSVVGPELETVVTGGLVACIAVAVGMKARKAQLASAAPLLPDSTFTARNVIEIITDACVKLADAVMGRANRKYVPFAASLFIFIFFCNLIGLIPGFSMPTDSLQFNAGLALVVFVLYNFWGIREVGIVAYLKHFGGPVVFIAPFLFVIELISHVIRPVSLSLRLYGNMTGDHSAIEAFTELTKVGIPVVFYFLGTFVCLVQAFVFTLLTMVYIRLAVVHEDSHH